MVLNLSESELTSIYFLDLNVNSLLESELTSILLTLKLKAVGEEINMRVKVISRSTDEFTRERSQDLQVWPFYHFLLCVVEL